MGWRRVGIIMAGGSGERFWPVSTRSKPKQFLRLGRPDQSLLQEAVDRASDIFGIEDTYVATGELWAELSQSDCPQLLPGHVLVEPAKRNTTGCLVWAAATFMARFEDWSQISMAILTADHRITPQEGFAASVRKALDVAEETGGIATIGIPPDRPETGYGYIQTADEVNGTFTVDSFKEKPDAETAQSYMASGKHLWNSGMFFWTLPAFLAELSLADKSLAETTYELAGLIKSGELERAQSVFESLPSISIDFALMEKAKRVFVVKASFDWDDLGAWDALRRTYPMDESQSVSLGESRQVHSTSTVVYNENPDQEVCLLGVENLIVVVTKDKIMICPADRAQDVRLLSNP